MTIPWTRIGTKQQTGDTNVCCPFAIGGLPIYQRGLLCYIMLEL